MPIASTDLKKYAAANRPEDDASASGGGITTSHSLEITQPAAPTALEVVSSQAGDTTQVLTVKGRDSAGTLITATAALNGTTAVALAGTFERVLEAGLSAAAAGTVTLRASGGGATVCTLPPGQLGQHILFKRSASDPTASRVRYEKEFWKNEHASLSLQNATLTLTADPAAKVEMGVAGAVNDTISVANRLTAPTGITFVNDNVAQSVPGGALAAGAAIGVWIKQTLAAGDAPVKSTYTTELSGDTT